MGVELKPCPFCGGTAHIEQPGTRRQSCVVECDSCGLNHESGDEGEMCGTSWNRREGEAARIQQQALNYESLLAQHTASLERIDELELKPKRSISLQAQCDEHLARIAELEREKDEVEKHAAVVSSENFDLEARIAELDRKHKEAWDDCGELNATNHELLAACGEKDRRIAELEKERDGLRSCVKEALAQCVFDMATDEDPLADRMRAALQAEKETRS